MLIDVFDVENKTKRYVSDKEVFGRPLAGVYFIQVSEEWNMPIKIGHALDVGKRFDDLQCAHYEGLYIKLVCESSKPQKLEQFFHEVFAAGRIRGEWFEATELLLGFVTNPVEQIDYLWWQADFPFSDLYMEKARKSVNGPVEEALFELFRDEWTVLRLFGTAVKFDNINSQAWKFGRMLRGRGYDFDQSEVGQALTAARGWWD